MTKKEKVPQNEKIQKPIFKKWWFWVLVVLVIGAIGSALSGGDDVAPSDTSQPPAQAETQLPDSESQGTDSAGTESINPEQSETPDSHARKALEDVLGSTTFYENVRNDTTGRWRVLVFYSPENIVDHAVEYYNAYFSADDEVHIAVNLGLKTTSVMNVANGSMYLDVHEYVDGEEHDAKVLGGGDLLKSYIIDIATGEVEDLSDTSNE